jgi:hypothetical protein
MRKFFLIAFIMTFVTACTDYKAQINDAHDEFLSENTFVNKTGIPCGDLWCGPAKQKKVDTGESKGHWASYVDDTDGGSSYFTWEDGTTGTLNSVMAEKLTYDFLGIGGYFHLGENYRYAYATVVAEFGNITNASPWEGVCVVYYSTAPVRLYLSFENAADYGYDMPFVDLPRMDGAYVGGGYFGTVDYDGHTYEFGVVEVFWDQFVQDGWSHMVIDSRAAAERLSALDFQFKYELMSENGGDRDGKFKIYSIGRPGTCK